MRKIEPIRTALFVPGNRPERVDKACGSAADAIVIDLEDAVPAADKEATRVLVREKILQHRDSRLLVRVNSLETGLVPGDLEKIAVPGLCGILLPKTARPGDLEQVNALLGEAERRNGLPAGSVVVLALIESALGIENAFAIASVRNDPHRLFTMAFGAADYTLDMGIEISQSGEELLYPRARMAVACRAAGIEPPLDTPFMVDIKNLSALQAEARRAKQLGFQGKLCIHPNQVDVCNAIFSPTDAEIAHSRKVIEAFEAAEAQGQAAIQMDGKLIDYPVVAQARRILTRAARSPGSRPVTEGHT